MSIVAVAKFPAKLADFLDQEQYGYLLEAALEAFAGDVARYLKTTFSKGTIGMKANCLARLNPTFVPLADAVTQLLVDRSGRDENDVIVWERSNRELKNAGYELNASSFGRRCLGTDTNGVGHSRDFYRFGQANSLVSRILTDMLNHNINLPILKDHSIAGLSAGMKNMFGAVNNPNKYHGNNCDPYAADVNNLAPIREKHRLTIIDAVRIQYDNGPGFDSRSIDYYNGLIISDDPVAADRIALEVLDNRRVRNGRKPLAEVGREVKYLASAENTGLGIADITKIDLRVVTIDDHGKTLKTDEELF